MANFRLPPLRRNDMAAQGARSRYSVQIYVLVGAIACLVVGALVYSTRTGARMVSKYATLADAAVEIQYLATTAHLWCEEIVSGDRQEDIAIVWKNIDAAEQYARAMLNGGPCDGAVFIPLADPTLRADISDVLDKLQDFRAVAQERLKHPSQAAAGTPIDQKFDAVFNSFLDQAKVVDIKLRRHMIHDLYRFRFTQTLLIVVCAGLAVIVGIVLHHDRLHIVRNQQAIEESERRFRQLVEHASDAILLFEPDGRIVDTNQAASETLGYKRDEFLKMSTSELEAESTGTCLQGQAPNAPPATLEGTLRRKDGLTLPTEVRLRAFSSAGRDLTLASLRDITERRLDEREREKLIQRLESQNEELERFAYTVSHDLRTPLITVKGFLGLLEQDLAEGNDEAVADDLSRSRRAADHMECLLRELLDLSRIGRIANSPEEIALEDLVSEVLEMAAVSLAQREVKVEVAENLPSVFGDRKRLREVFQNLIENAIKYMGDQPFPQISIDAAGSDGVVTCRVRDNGIGIAPKFHERVFSLFEKLDTESPGTGIGLALVKRIVEVHGGRIWVESEGDGNGSCFCFELPAASTATQFSQSDLVAQGRV